MTSLEWAESVLALIREHKNTAAGIPHKHKMLEKAVDSFDWAGYNAKVKPGLEKAFEAILTTEAKKMAEELGIAFERVDPYMQTKLTKYVTDRVTELVGTTKADVKALIRKRLDELSQVPTSGTLGPGSPLKLGDEIRDLIRKTIPGYAEWRADRIARTETAIAYNHGSVFAMRQAGVSKVQVSDGDCDKCKPFDGKIFPLAWALDHPVQHPNCVRAFSPVVEEFKPKTPNPETFVPPAPKPAPKPVNLAPPGPAFKPAGTVVAPVNAPLSQAIAANATGTVHWTPQGWVSMGTPYVPKPVTAPPPPPKPVEPAHFQQPAAKPVAPGPGVTGLHKPAWADETPRYFGAKFEREMYERGSTFMKTKLTEAERRVIVQYTDSGYSAMNNLLRGRQTGFVGSEVTHLETRVTTLRSAFQKAPEHQETVVVWRGVSAAPTPTWLQENFQPGMRVRLDGFQSTTINPDVAASWAGGGTMFEIHTRKGIYVRPESQHSREYEFLLDHGQAFEVQGVKEITLGTGPSARKRKVIQLVHIGDASQVAAKPVSKPTKSDPALTVWATEEQVDKFTQSMDSVVFL